MSRDYYQHIQECNQDIRFSQKEKKTSSEDSAKSDNRRKIPRLRSVIKIVPPKRQPPKENRTPASESSSVASSLIPNRRSAPPSIPRAPMPIRIGIQPTNPFKIPQQPLTEKDQNIHPSTQKGIGK